MLGLSSSGKGQFQLNGGAQVQLKLTEVRIVGVEVEGKQAS